MYAVPNALPMHFEPKRTGPDRTKAITYRIQRMQQLTITIIAMCLTLRPPLRMPICTHGLAELKLWWTIRVSIQCDATTDLWLYACLVELNLLYIYAHGMVAGE